MLRIPNDDYVHVSYRIAELRRHPPAGRVVYLFGGSGTMEMMRSEAALARMSRLPAAPESPSSAWRRTSRASARRWR